MAKKSLACLLNGHETCHEASNGDYRNCKSCIRHKAFVYGPRGRKDRYFMIKAHCKYCGQVDFTGETFFKEDPCPKGYAVCSTRR